MRGAGAAIDPDIRRARTLPSAFYRDAQVHALLGDRLFARSWQLVGDAKVLPPPDEGRGARLSPRSFMPGLLDDPLLLVRDGGGGIACFSNVCTHRGAILCEKEVCVRAIRCPYHGRQFDTDGRFRSMPGFEGALDFPSPEDDLPRVPLERLGPLLFASLDPAVPFADLVTPLLARVGFLPLERLALDAATSRTYDVRANWALYCDNYLEGLHVPFVHPMLATRIDPKDYRIELFPHGSLQIGIAAEGEPHFDLPEGHPDAGSRVAGYYFWLAPNTMLNVYPWGISVNIVRPLAVDRTRVEYRGYVLDAALRDRGAGSGLHDVEMEDEGVVESVQRGISSRLYRRGRYAPHGERAVHHFHRMLAAALEG